MDSNTKQLYNSLLAKKLIAEFGRRNMEGFYCETKEEALQTALEMLEPGALISCGGSATLDEIGLREALISGSYRFLDPSTPKTGKEKEEAAHQALGADYFLMGCNAISQTGELVNADGIGNRTAALLFGPRRVIVIAGLNKVEPTLDAAILRTKVKAAQLITLHFRSGFEDFDALAEAASGACCHLTVTSGCVMKGRIKIILVGEALGY